MTSARFILEFAAACLISVTLWFAIGGKCEKAPHPEDGPE